MINDLITVFQMNWLLFLALFIIIGLLVGNEIFQKINGIKIIDYPEVLYFINEKDAWILDVREIKDYTNGHILHAHHIPISALLSRINELPQSVNIPIIIYCSNGVISKNAFFLLKKCGISNTYILNGGLRRWLDAQLPVTKE